jgi:hypothetical protein
MSYSFRSFYFHISCYCIEKIINLTTSYKVSTKISNCFTEINNLSANSINKIEYNSGLILFFINYLTYIITIFLILLIIE